MLSVIAVLFAIVVSLPVVEILRIRTVSDADWLTWIRKSAPLIVVEKTNDLAVVAS